MTKPVHEFVPRPRRCALIGCAFFLAAGAYSITDWLGHGSWYSPLPFAALLLAFAAGWWWWALRDRRTLIRRRSDLCVSCGHELTDNVSGICPECGAGGLCVSCGYNLTGNVSGVCPECGEEV